MNFTCMSSSFSLQAFGSNVATIEHSANYLYTEFAKRKTLCSTNTSYTVFDRFVALRTISFCHNQKMRKKYSFQQIFNKCDAIQSIYYQSHSLYYIHVYIIRNTYISQYLKFFFNKKRLFWTLLDPIHELTNIQA